MLKILIVTAASLVMLTAAAADPPRKERSRPADPIGKARVVKKPVVKAVTGNYPQKPQGTQASPLENHLRGGDVPPIDAR